MALENQKKVAVLLELSKKNFYFIQKMLSEFGYTSLPLFPPGKLGPQDLFIAYLGSRSPTLFDRSLDVIRNYSGPSVPVIFLVDYGPVTTHGQAYISPMDGQALRAIINLLKENPCPGGTG